MADKPLTIILEWTADCIKYMGDKLFLNTGSNEVPVSAWEKLRWTVADIVVADGTKLSESQRKEGRIIEIAAEVVADPKNAQKSEVKMAASLKDMEVQEAIEVVGTCSNLDTLKTWKKKETRDSVLQAINEQVAKVEE